MRRERRERIKKRKRIRRKRRERIKKRKRSPSELQAELFEKF